MQIIMLTDAQRKALESCLKYGEAAVSANEYETGEAQKLHKRIQEIQQQLMQDSDGEIGTMNASKEQTRKAQYHLAIVLNRIGKNSPNYDELSSVQAFLTAAERKLPTEASYEQAKQHSK